MKCAQYNGTSESSVSSRSPRLTDECSQLLLKLFPKQTVDDEIHRTVDGDDEITDVVEPEVVGAGGSLFLVDDVEEYLIDRRRCLADDERDDDDNEYECNIVLLGTRPTNQSLPRVTRLTQSADQVDIQHDENNEWKYVCDETVRDVLVENIVQLVGSQSDIDFYRPTERHVCDVIGLRVIHCDVFVLGEARQIVDGGTYKKHRYLQSDVMFGAESSGV